VGPKFSLASKGLLMLNGDAVHPGYGRKRNPKDESWYPEDDVRLHFVVTNIGPDKIALFRGEPIAHLRLYSAESIPVESDARNQSFIKLADRLFDRGSIYFRTIQDVGKEVEDTKSRLDRMEVRAAAHDIAINRVTDVQSLIIVFGVFLISATLLGVVLTALVNIFENLPSHLSSGREALIALFATIYGLSCTIGVILVVSVIGPIARRMARRGDPPRNRP